MGRNFLHANNMSALVNLSGFPYFVVNATAFPLATAYEHSTHAAHNTAKTGRATLKFRAIGFIMTLNSSRVRRPRFLSHPNDVRDVVLVV